MIFLYIDPGSGYSFFNAGAALLAFLAGVFGAGWFFLKKLFKFIGRHKRPVIGIFLVGLSILIAGVVMMKPVATFNKKVVVLGIDALSPQIMEPMMREGRLPNFERLKKSGSYDHLLTTNPAQSPVAWAAFATGKNPGVNGVFDFIVRDRRDYGLDLVFSRMERGRPVSPLKAKGFWEYTSARKVNTVVLGCPGTFPPHKLHGKMLSGMGVPDILGTQGTFTFYTSTPSEGRDVGGQVIMVEKAKVMSMDLLGPNLRDLDGGERRARVPFTVTVLGKDRVMVECGKKKLELEAGRWSGWQEVEFDLGFLRRAKGIYRMCLLEAGAAFRLYVSPINFDPRAPLFPISYPEGYARALADAQGLYYTQGMPMDVWGLNEQRLSEDVFLEQVEDVWRQRAGTFAHEFEQMKSGVLFAYFDGIDIIQHMFWRYRDPAYLAQDKKYTAEIERWYERVDALLGDVLKKIGKDDLLIVLSDHGFASFQRAVHLNAWLMQQGYLSLKDPLVVSGGELLEDVDWTRTKAYAVGFGGIYLNRKGREGQGIVRPGPEEDALKTEISRGLEALVDGQGGAAVVHKIYRREEIFSGPYAKDAPDIVVGFNAGYRASWQTAMGAAPEVLIEDNTKKWSGDHLFDPSLVPGVVFCNRPMGPRPTIYDIVPTVLKFIGYGPAQIKKFKFDGKPLI